MKGYQIGAVPGQQGFKDYFGAAPSIILVRPDGYVALTGSDKSVAKITEFCETWLIPETSSAKVEAAHA